ncbi:hypothetical protein P152DRAFT_296163 [Eremomyces bilateralis CBS 781.70]|uniref:Uncharacterized protein n=1 Tax=Eremomyces bilateralis CBS 781.70 TaxID=1392243 RepID=A0A6G1G758_9PEZI|nr:uncharacterized protein P152DRAFT_296163 [Eremomyces bilateralis CBS 781.70]KAF1813883.1 hypothetical protein P152DRAFT_296163 [Eremomyces bilateralis CBS 781.70]
MPYPLHDHEIVPRVFLRSGIKARQRPWEGRRLIAPSSFDVFVGVKKAVRAVRNEDTTLLRRHTKERDRHEDPVPTERHLHNPQSTVHNPQSTMALRCIGAKHQETAVVREQRHAKSGKQTRAESRPICRNPFGLAHWRVRRLWRRHSAVQFESGPVTREEGTGGK